MSMMVSFVLSFFPRDVLDEILNLIESVSEDFPSYSLIVINYQENTSMRYTYDLGLKIPFLNWVKCVTRTSDRKSVLGLKNH